MKEYEKRYEDVFTHPNTLSKCKLDRVEIVGMETDDYIELFRDTLLEYEKVSYDICIKHAWLMRKFVYKGQRIRTHLPKGRSLDSAFAVFVRNYVGHDFKTFTKNKMLLKIMSYFDDLYPDFDVNNPFEQEYKYPYKNVNIEAMALVYQMPERLELLQICEDRNMSHLKFMDYVINYINCYNEEVGENVFDFIFSTALIPYIRYNNKNNKKYEGKEIETSNVRKG